MATLLSAFLGNATAMSLHWFTWWVRLHHRRWSVAAGALGALGITALGMIYVTASDIGHLVLTPLVLFWSFALIIGILQAASIATPWWAGVFGLLFEMALGFITLSAINLSLQKLVLQWQLANRFPDTFAHPEVIRDQTSYVFLVSAGVLALIRPVVQMRRPG